MTIHLGNVDAGITLYIPWHTFDSNGASITLTGLAVTDIEIYKNGSVTQRSSDAGYALLDTDGIDFDGITGIHGISIDLNDNTDAGFYSAGAFYWVVISAITVDTRTLNFILATFRIGPAAANATQWNGTAVATPATAGIPDVNVKNIDNDAASASGTVTFPNATLASTTNITAGTITTATNVTTVNGLAAGVITAASIAADAITDAKVASDVTIASVTGAVGSVTGNVGGNVTGSVGSVVATVAANLTQILGTALTETAGQIAAAFKQFFDVAAPTGTMKAITNVVTATNLTNAPTAGDFTAVMKTSLNAATPASVQNISAQTGDSFARLGAPAGASVSVDIAAVKAETASIQSDTNDLQARTPAALVSGRMDASVGAMATDVLTNTALAASAVTEIQTGLATPTNITAGVITTVTNLTNAPTAGDLTATMKASVNAEILDVFTVDTFAQPGQEAPAATQTLKNILTYLYKFLRNRITQTSTTLSVYADNGTTVDQVATISDSGTYDRGEIGSGP